MKTSVVFRSAALFAILYQFRLVADDLADTAIFSAALFAAFVAAAFLAHVSADGRKANPAVAVISIGLIPWIARLFIALPGMFFSSVSLDSLLLNFDRNNFVNLLPFYWISISTWFSIRSRVFLRAAVIADTVILTAIFSFTRVSGIALYRWPVVLIVMLAGIVFAQALALLFSLPPALRLRKTEKTAAIAVLLTLVFIGGLLFLKPSQERAIQKGGGLLEPNLFSFDFSQFLRLDTEISMSDDLVMIVKKDPDDDHILLRRSVMSGYSKKQGFYRVESVDERTHPQRLPAGPTQLFPAEFEAARKVRQEYFMVNFDASAFIGMKEPVEITPYENWDASSFKSAYSVESLVSDAIIDELDTAWPGPAELGLSEAELALYTNYDGDERIRALAEALTGNFDNYTDKVYMVLHWLKYGQFRYSLKPGIAPDGDQLAWFLFNSKKGYCSYYAFAMALMLRSVGIPARVAAGFFIDPESGVFDYYAVRSDMAHAWVEVPFPGYGWIEFDPTSENLAEGEEFRMSAGVDPQLFERLMREILENRSGLRAKMGQDMADASPDSRSLLRLTAELLQKTLPILLIVFAIILLTIIRCGRLLLSVLYRDSRKKAVSLWKHARGRLRLAGLARSPALAESEWALRADSLVQGTYVLYLEAAAARFAPEYRREDFTRLRGAYRLFSESYRNSVSAGRRLLAWIFPPAACMRRRSGLTLLLLILVLGSANIRAQSTGPASSAMPADALYRSAIEAEYAENWDRAIELYREGGLQHPDDLRFPRALGNLYYNRSLYGLAWEEYRKVEQANPYDSYVLFRLASTAAFLNHDRVSVAYYEKLLSIDPDNQDAIGNLGWMYYKVHRLEDGERLLTSALERFGDEADLAMTLATIYSDMYRYEEGKYWYQKSITLAEPERSFTSVAHYNLSILESRFLRYDLAMNEANASLEAQNRASGHLARGELYLRRLDLAEAQSDYETAREMDSSPLAKVSLAQVYQISGRLEEARLYALDCLKAGDQSWMMYYGIDPVRYKRDIHEILYETYAGLALAERFTPCASPAERIHSWLRMLSFGFYGTVHRMLFQKYSLAAGDAYDDANVTAGDDTVKDIPPVEQLIQYYNAFETYPRRALVYLNKAREFETAIVPESEAAYTLERSIALRDRGLAIQALEEFNPVWERDMVAKCYRELIRSGPRQARYSAAEELFALNRGALLQAGAGLPVEINLLYDDNVRLREQRLYRPLAQAGFIRRTAKDGSNAAKAAPPRFRLDLNISESPAGAYTLAAELTDTQGGQSPLSRTIPLPSLSKADLYKAAASLRDIVFRVE